VLGLSGEVGNNLVNLSDGVTPRVAYAAAHTLVVLTGTNRAQTFLQGHKSAITCIAATPDHSIVVTGDSGRESLLVFWDVEAGEPLRIIQSPHAFGTAAVDISGDGTVMATVSAVDPETGAQEVAMWDLNQLHGGGPMQPTVLGSVPPGAPRALARARAARLFPRSRVRPLPLPPSLRLLGTAARCCPASLRGRTHGC
jgi:hypothetical protein